MAFSVSSVLMLSLKVCVFCSLFARAGVLLFDASLLCADNDDDKDAIITVLIKKLRVSFTDENC